MNPAKMREGIDQIVNGFLKMKEALAQKIDEIPPDPATQAAPTKLETPLAPPAVQSNSNNSQDLDDFEQLKSVLVSDRWPEAVNKHLVCDPNSESDKAERGMGVIELIIDTPLKNTKFLDFGCHEGHATHYVAKEGATIAVGYDIQHFPSWEQKKETNLIFTADWTRVIENGPYDTILLYDVLDHVQKETPTEILKKAANVLNHTGKIYMRTHPWCSRHGTHLYHDLNKAFVHLIFTEEELARLVTPSFQEPNLKVCFPIMQYDKYIKDAGLRQISRRDIKDPIEPFFKTPTIAKRIMANGDYGNFPDWQSSLSFLDFVLIKD